MDDLLHLLHSEQADSLRLREGQPPVLILDGKPHAIEGPAITAGDAELLLHEIANTRQRRRLREQGEVKFIFRFRGRVDFVIRASLQAEQLAIDIH